MQSDRERISYYQELIMRNEQVWLKTSNQADKEILKKQIETFRKLLFRFRTQAANRIIKTSQLELF